MASDQTMGRLLTRCGGDCELCGATAELSAWAVPPAVELEVERAVAICLVCRAQLDSGQLDAKHWLCLNQSAWSEHPPVQVVAWRLLHRLTDGWAQDLLDQLYLDDDTLAWAKQELASEAEDSTVPLDSNGTALQEGDSVTLIKDLEVKGANFTAKRGTLVKGIHLTGSADTVEGRVNKTTIVLKTCFLKKVT